MILHFPVLMTLDSYRNISDNYFTKHGRYQTRSRIWLYKCSSAWSQEYIVCQMNVRSRRVGSCDWWNIFCQYTLWPMRRWKIMITSRLDHVWGLPANRILSWSFSAFVVGSSRSGCKEMIVFPSMFRMICTESRSRHKARSAVQDTYGQWQISGWKLWQTFEL